MIAALKREKLVIREKTNYMEVAGNNRVTYRVTVGRIIESSKEYVIYGVEAEIKIGPVVLNESIDDFSIDLKSTVSFVEMLLKYKIKPSQIYNAALCFLRENI